MAIDASFLDELRKFELVLKRQVNSKYQGDRQSRSIGSGLMFRDHAKYTPGDDIRMIDWKVYARTEKLFVKRFEEERNMTIHVLLDASSSMDFGKKTSKFDYGGMVGLSFAFMASRNNEKFEFTTFSDSLEVLKPRYGKQPLVNVLDQLNNTKPKGRSKLRESLEAYRQGHIRSKSMLILISDFWYDPEEIEEVLIRYKRSEVFIVQVLDPQEQDLEFKGDVLLEDMESKTTLRTFISNRFREKYKRRLGDHISDLQNLADHHKANFITVRTDQPIFDAVHQILNAGQVKKHVS